MSSLNIKARDTFIFDFDGVIIDSNSIKRNAIKLVAEKFLSPSLVSDFIGFFTQNNGAPRRGKIEKFFRQDDIEDALEEYASNLERTLSHAPFIPGVQVFLQKLNELQPRPRIYILSGGEINEIQKVLSQNNLLHFFDCIYAAPKTKIENLECMPFLGNAVFFGDSEIDHAVALESNVDFIFIYGASDVIDVNKICTSNATIAIFEDFKGVLSDSSWD